MKREQEPQEKPLLSGSIELFSFNSYLFKHRVIAMDSLVSARAPLTPSPVFPGEKRTSRSK